MLPTVQSAVEEPRVRSWIKGALLWDAFGGNKQGSMRALRREWSQAMNVVIVGPDASALGGDEAEGAGVLVPGGWSANGQPNDGFHQW